MHVLLIVWNPEFFTLRLKKVSLTSFNSVAWINRITHTFRLQRLTFTRGMPLDYPRATLFYQMPPYKNWHQLICIKPFQYLINDKLLPTVYPKKYARGFWFAVLCCGITLTDFPISIRLTSLALWQSNDCPSASKATLMNMDKYFMWIHYERLHNHNKAKHNKTVCIFHGIYCRLLVNSAPLQNEIKTR